MCRTSVIKRKLLRDQKQWIRKRITVKFAKDSLVLAFATGAAVWFFAGTYHFLMWKLYSKPFAHESDSTSNSLCILLVQLSYPIETRFKFPTPGQRTTVKYLRAGLEGCWSFELMAAYLMSLADLIELFINLTPIHAPVYFLINNPPSLKDQFYTEKKS